MLLGVSNFFWVKIQLCPTLGEGVLRGQKRKTFSFLSQLIENQKLYSISKNQPFKSIRKGDMEISTFFDLKKKAFSFPIFSPNCARKLKFGMYI